MIEGPSNTPKPVTEDAELAKKFPQPEKVLRFEDSHGVIHTASSEEEMAQMRQDEREAA